MKLRPGILIPILIASAPGASGCQLLYEKNELTVETGGAGPTTTTAPATGGGGAGGTTTTDPTGSTTSVGGTGGAGGSTTTTAMGGTGGTGGTGGAGGSVTTTTTTTTCDEPLFLFATSSTEVLCAAFDGVSGWTLDADANGSSNARPAAALVDATAGVGLFYQGPAGGMGPLRAVELTGGACSAPADVLTVTTKAAPAAAVLGGKVQALFQGAVGAGTDHPFVAAWDPATKWAAPAQIDMNVFSPTVASLATSGAEMLAAYGGGDDNLYGVRYGGGSWLLPAACFKDAASDCEQANKTLTPAVAGLDAGGWLVVFQEKAGATPLRWLTATPMGNAPSQALAGAASASPVALARTSGGAVLAFRGTNDKVYAAVYSPAAGTWGAVQQVGAGSTQASPAVAAGVCTHEAELVYIEASDGSIRHASLEGGAWSAPALVGGASMKGVALAGLP